MIYTNFTQLERYLGISEELDTAIRYLKTADLTKLVKGRNEVSGEDVFVNCFAYDTLPEEQAIWEGHIQYADIHVVLSGEEKIGVTDVSRLTVTSRDEANDFIGYEGAVETWVSLRPGDILVVYPEDIHMVKVRIQDTCTVEKAVVKVRVG